jgi:hypothetical protein
MTGKESNARQQEYCVQNDTNQVEHNETQTSELTGAKRADLNWEFWRKSGLPAGIPHQAARIARDPRRRSTSLTAGSAKVSAGCFF